MKLQIAYAVCRGRNKSVSDDSALIGRTVINEKYGILETETPAAIALCDGVGGNAGGKDASLFVCGRLAELSPSIKEQELRPALQDINAELIACAAQTPEKRHMATTMTGLLFGEDGIFLMHAGNTRLYTLRGGYLQQLTEDHTTYQWLMSTGQTEAAEGCNKSEIRCAFGGGREELLRSLKVETVFERRIPKQILLTTDGVHDTLPEDGLEALFASELPPQEKVLAITEEALRLGTEDDRSALLITVVE